MNKIYKYLLLTLILASAGFLTIQHYLDPIYNVKVGKDVNLDDNRIENWGGRFSDDDNIFIGFNTRLDEGAEITVRIFNDEVGSFGGTVRYISVEKDENFYWFAMSGDISPGKYIVNFKIDNIVVESTTFIIDIKEVE